MVESVFYIKQFIKKIGMILGGILLNFFICFGVSKLIIYVLGGCSSASITPCGTEVIAMILGIILFIVIIAYSIYFIDEIGAFNIEHPKELYGKEMNEKSH